MKVLLVAGARPNFMKVAPLLAELRRCGHRVTLVHTGQHYDPQMSDAFFDDLGISQPDYHLGVGSGSHALQTARLLEGFEPVLLAVRPDWLVVVGDVNSTLACALVAAKLGCPVAHVEAGLRSGDWRMPEEINRVLTDRLSDLLLTPSRDAHPNLAQEGIEASRVVFVGNVMIDTLFRHLDQARDRDVPGRLGLKRGEYVVTTVHRPSNVDDPVILSEIFTGLSQVAQRMPVVFPMHPRTRRSAEANGLLDELSRFRVVEPLGYLDMLGLIEAAAVCLTDSGGLQEETTALGVPCVTLREQTERPITVAEGTNRMVRWPLTSEGLLEAFDAALAQGVVAPGSRCPEGWDGHASRRIVEALQVHLHAVTPTEPSGSSRAGLLR